MSTPLVGLVDQAVTSANVVSWDVNKIGGLPVWLNQLQAGGTVTCRVCGQDLTLVTQLYCPLGGSNYHRCLYIFVCLHQACPCQCQVFRCLKIDPSYSKKIKDVPGNTPQSLNSDMWADDQDDWGDGNDNWGDEDDDWGDEEDLHCDIDNNIQGVSINESASAHAVASELCHNSGPSSNDGSTNRSGNDSELPVAVSLMTISDKKDFQSYPEGVENVHFTEASQTIVTTSGSGGDAAGVIGENIGPQSDRYEHLATLLNTKFNSASLTPNIDRMETLTFEPFYLYVIEEHHSKAANKQDDVSKHVANLIKEYEKCEGKQLETLMAESVKNKGKGSNESYEKAELKHGDKVFHKFLKRLQTCPDQCIRYDRGGDPLLALELKGEKSVIPPCPLCGRQRIFELQLLPALIPALRLKEGNNPVEFSTILIFTCQDNCVPSDPGHILIEEVAIYQGDPDQHLYRS